MTKNKYQVKTCNMTNSFNQIHHCKLIYFIEYVRQSTAIVQHYTGKGPAKNNAQYWHKSSVTSEIMAMQPKPVLFDRVHCFLPQISKNKAKQALRSEWPTVQSLEVHQYYEDIK